VSVYVPAARPDRLAVTAIVPDALPPADATVSHGCVLVALHESVPPEIVTPTDCAVGLLDPATPVNVRDTGDRLRLGAAEIVSVTGTLPGDDAAPGAVTVTAPV